MEREYVCSHPNYPRKKNIYRETYGVLKKLGCFGNKNNVTSEHFITTGLKTILRIPKRKQSKKKVAKYTRII
jgi:hypothetical protein